MNRRIFLNVLVVALMGLASIAHAEDEKKDKGNRRDPMAAALEKADLTADQKEKVKAINEEFHTAAKAAREAKDREAFTKARDERHEKIMALLTDEQKEIVKKYLAENAPPRGKDRKPKDQTN